MIEVIREILATTTYDFRTWANPADEFAHLFPDWVDYYRLKHAIARALAPRSICEIGVRYGYSAMAFLRAAPAASYVGIDNNSTSSGGATNAVGWAKEALKEFHAELLVADSQRLSSLPGGPYDLVHVDGQQDGDGTFHDLELAFEKADWILVDGFLWTDLNQLSTGCFLRKYRRFIEYAVLMPGYAGELLVRLKGSAPRRTGLSRASGYAQLSSAYDRTYYLSDCGGHDEFRKFRGLRLLDDRLVTVLHLCEPGREAAILDVGCGRGELSFAMARTGAKVVGIDYSSSAIDLVREHYRDYCGTCGLRLSFECGDVLAYETALRFDTVVMADVVEHIEDGSLDRLFARIKTLLAPSGKVIVHTAPNLEYYRRTYADRVDRARSCGLYLPANPRSYFEDLLHINEQTPASLEHALGRHFPAVRVWVPHPDAIGSLRDGLDETNLAGANSIYAVASCAPVDDRLIMRCLSQERLQTHDLDVTIDATAPEMRLRAGKSGMLKIRLSNCSCQRLASLPPYPVHVAYHWLRPDGTTEVYDGLRTPIQGPLRAGHSMSMDLDFVAPGRPGKYTLAVTLVQETCFWFEQFVPTLPRTIAVNVD